MFIKYKLVNYVHVKIAVFFPGRKIRAFRGDNEGETRNNIDIE